MYIPADDDTGHDAATDIIARAVRPAKVNRAPVPVSVARDLVLDVHEALGEDDWVRASDMAARLRELAASYRLYANLDGTELARLLAVEGVDVRRKDGYPVIRAERVLRVLDARQRWSE